MKNLFFAMAIIITPVSIKAKTMIISDIDDTIKISHILGYKFSALRMKKEFTGLSALYNAFICNKEESQKKRTYCKNNRGLVHSDKRWVNYVTGAPGRLQVFGREFLSLTSYPQGVVKGKGSHSVGTHEFKRSEISNIIKNTNMNSYILIGDNGEHDPIAYYEASQKFPKKDINMYLHKIYSLDNNEDEVGKKLEKNQVPYLTASDLAVHFYKKKLIEEKDVLRISKLVLSDLQHPDNFENVIASWFRCTDFFNEYDYPKVTLKEKTLDILRQVNLLAQMRCNQVKDD